MKSWFLVQSYCFMRAIITVSVCVSNMIMSNYVCASLELACVRVCLHKQTPASKLLFIHVCLRVWSTFLLSLLIIAKGGDDDVAVVPHSTPLCQLKSARCPRLHSAIVHVCMHFCLFAWPLHAIYDFSSL